MEKLKPKLFSVMKTYTKEQFVKDVIAGIIVAIIALPLSIALALASGVNPERGLYTAIVAGFIIAFLGGSRVQISGPTAAFATIVAGIVASDGIEGLAIATIMAGIFLILMGIMQGAISYSTASLEKNKEIRANTASVLNQLTQTAVSDQKEQNISFYAVGSDGRIGNKVFDVQTKLGKKKVVYTDTKGQQQETTFYLYDSVENTTGSGGDTP